MFQGLWPINSDMPPLCVPTHILKLHFNPNDTPVMFHDYCSTDKTQYVPLDTQTPAKILNITFVVVLTKTTVYMQTLTVWKVKVLYWIWKDLVGVVINAHCFLSFLKTNFFRKLSAPDESSTPLVRSSERLAAKRRGLKAESLETLYFTPINTRQVKRCFCGHTPYTFLALDWL